MVQSASGAWAAGCTPRLASRGESTTGCGAPRQCFLDAKALSEVAEELACVPESSCGEPNEKIGVVVDRDGTRYYLMNATPRHATTMQLIKIAIFNTQSLAPISGNLECIFDNKTLPEPDGQKQSDLLDQSKTPISNDNAAKNSVDCQTNCPGAKALPKNNVKKSKESVITKNLCNPPTVVSTTRLPEKLFGTSISLVSARKSCSTPNLGRKLNAKPIRNTTCNLKKRFNYIGHTVKSPEPNVTTEKMASVDGLQTVITSQTNLEMKSECDFVYQ